MPVAHITRREQFNAAHRLYRPELNDTENYDLYGKCSNPNWHGHNYTLLVTIKGEIDLTTGYIVNLKDLSRIIKDVIIEKIDHKNINIEVEFMKGIIPSTENLAVAIWQQLDSHIRNIGVELYCIKVQETENNYAEYFGQ